MRIIIQILFIIIYTILISNIVTKPDNSVRFDKHAISDTKEDNDINNKSDNNTYIKRDDAEKTDIPIFSLIILCCIAMVMITLKVVICILGISGIDIRFHWNRGFIGRNCTRLGNCCLSYFGNSDNVIQAQPDNHHDAYEMHNVPVEPV